MHMIRTLISAVMLAAALTATLPALAQQGNVYRSLEAGRARPAGVLHGTIASIDYSAGTLVLNNGARILVTPSTTISSGRGYRAFSDLRRGQHVAVDVSKVDGALVAQSIIVRE